MARSAAAGKPSLGPQDDPIASIGAVLTRLYRMWGRRQMETAQPVTTAMSRKDLNRALVVELVDESAQKGTDASVGDLALLLGIDPSAASRAVGDAIQGGHLRRVPSQHDARRALLELTDSGRQLLARHREHQRAVFETITADWTSRDREQFARLLGNYVDSMAQLRSNQTGSPDAHGTNRER